MKKIYILLIFITILPFFIKAQTPQKMSYQSIIRDSNGNLIKNANVGIQVSIQTTLSGNSVYCETHNATTNENGLLALEIGNGISCLGTFSGINWANGTYYIKIETDPLGGSNYTIENVNQLLSVPYALYAASSGGGSGGTQGPPGVNGKSVLNGLIDPDITIGDIGDFYINTVTNEIFGPKTNISWGSGVSLIGPQGIPGTGGSSVPGNNPGDMQYWNGSQWVLITGGVTGQTLTYCNGVPKWGPCQTLAVVSTIVPTGITSTTANVGGIITDQGSAPVTSRGICYSISPNPTTSSNTVLLGSGTGNFSTTLLGLSLNTTYYVRAFAINANGPSYGNQQIFTTSAFSLATLSSSAITSITYTSAVSGGVITNDGGGIITSRGVCWSISQNPTISDSYTTDGTGAGTFISILTGLNHNTTYYLRAYATNNAGTAYGNQLSFNTNTINLPTLTTNAISSIGNTSAVCGGLISNDGGGTVTERGICWSTSQSPQITDSHTSDGTGIGSFSSNLTNLLPGTIYYVRAYATNIAGTSYGNQQSFSTGIVMIPTLTTNAITAITANSAFSGGEIINDGGSSVNARGLCWNTTSGPTINNSITSNGSGIGTFTSSITGLSANTTYYVKAYATNNTGTAYGNEQTFTTLQGGGTGSTLIDIDGNAYDTVIIGNQAWMKQNLTVTRFNNGDSIPLVILDNQWISQTSAANCYVNNNINNNAVYGRLYNYYTVSDTRNICPVGWHVPTDAEWTILEDTLGGLLVAGGKMKETGISHWTSPNSFATNSSNFTGLPGGKRGSDGTYSIFGNSSYWWSSTTLGSAGIYRRLDFDVASVIESTHSFKNGLSIRCIKNVTIPIVSTASLSNLSSTSAACGGNVTSDGGSAVTARGICWSTSQNPTIANSSFTLNGSGNGAFSSTLSGLTPNTTYYYRAYATNGIGTAYGNQISFSTFQK